MRTKSEQEMQYKQPELYFIQIHKVILCNSGFDGGASTAGFEDGPNYEGEMQ